MSAAAQPAESPHPMFVSAPDGCAAERACAMDNSAEAAYGAHGPGQRRQRRPPPHQERERANG
jgi:hypothetical protein